MTESSSSSTSSLLAAKSDVEIEELLDRMLTRLALCDDSKLDPLLSKLLPLTISSLSSHSSFVRSKVLEILSHVNKRVKHQPAIGLPLLDLWKLYTDASATPMVKNFCIVYIEMAFERVNKKEKENMAPILVATISKLPHQHQEIILRIATKVIGECHTSPIDDDIAAKYRLANGSQEKELFIEFWLHTLLYQPPHQCGGCPPGLSIKQTNRVTGKLPLKIDELLTIKLGILNVIEAMDLVPELVYPLYLAASVDSQEPVAKRGEELIKKNTSSTDLDNAKLINRLFLLFNGSSAAENLSPESTVTPANNALKAKLMAVFCRSITAANSFPSTLQCIFGCIYGSGSTSRLKQFGMEFTVWVFKHAKVDQLKLMGPVILNGVLKLLDGFSSSESDVIVRETKTFSFQAIGLLAQRLPQLFSDKIDMAVRLFNALKLETQSLRFVIQEATNLLASAYKGAPVTILKELETLLLNSSQAEESEVRFCAVRWATTLFDAQHCPSRFICMVGAADSKLDIREMALEGLFLKDEGHNMSSDLDIKFPKLGDMLKYVLKQQPMLLNFSETREHRLIFPSKMYVVVIKFLSKCFESESGHDNSIVEKMYLLLEHAMAFEGSSELHATATKFIVTLGSCLLEITSAHYSLRISWLKQLLSHVDLDTRESAARILGMASSALPNSEASALLCELISSISGMPKLKYEAQHGALCAIGFVAADCCSKIPAIPDTVLQNTLKCLIDVVNSETASLASVAMQALGHIGLRTQLPPLVNNTSQVEVLVALHEKLRKLISGDDMKAIQRVVISLGHIGAKETSSSQLDIALDLIFSLSRSKVEDVLFAAGEALSFLWGGVAVTADVILKTNYSSLSMASNFLMGDVNSSFSKYSSNGKHETDEDCHAMVRDVITRRLFDGLLYSNRKEERCAGTVWLLSLTMYCGHQPTIQQMLPEIQDAFSHLLGQANELTQELASQGMSIVYELGDESMKKGLVDALVNTLTGTGKKKRSIKLLEDSEVFQEGAIGESPSGGKLSTYKELCSLANEMGQPDLIYKFMDLANYQASLNTKRGAAFGFSKIAKQAGDALQPHLRLLIPRLIRYQYDPDKNVQDAMAHIWKSLVQDPKKTIDGHLDLIFNDLLIQCGSRLWRSREASCLALADIIHGRKFDQVGKHLKRLWTAAFRAMDDIKETVRNAGDKLCRALTSLTIRLCDVSLTEIPDARQAMEIVVPLLLSEGILSKVDGIRKASIGVIMKLAKGAGVSLRPHLSDLVCCMLESLSGLEDQALNYVELHATNVGIQTDKLESLRISIAKSSPMWETLDLCLNVVNAETLDQLVPRLAQLIRSGVGLNTRVGVASFISLLVQKVGVDIKPFTSTLMRLLFPVVKEEKSTAAKRAFASACAMVLKYATASHAQNLIEDTAALYAGDRNSQISCAILFKCYSSTASDLLNRYQLVVVPAIFLSRFDDDKYVSELFEELWEENTSSERISLQLFLGEIVCLICEGIASSSWANKKKSAQAICKLSEVLGESLSSHHHLLLQSVMKEVPGRLWEGKEALLQAIGALSISCHRAISTEDPATPNSILTLVSSACTKKVKKYREAAFSCLEQIIKAFGNPEFFNSVFPILFEMCNSASLSQPRQAPLASHDAKTESKGVEDGYLPLDKIMDCLKSCIHVAFVNDILQQKNNLLDMLLISLSPGSPWIVKVSAFSTIKELCSRLGDSSTGTQETSLEGNGASFVLELFQSVSPRILECIKTVKIAQVHIAASECLLEVTKLYRQVLSQKPTETGFKEEILHLIEVEKNEEAKMFLKKSLDFLNKETVPEP